MIINIKNQQVFLNFWQILLNSSLFQRFGALIGSFLLHSAVLLLLFKIFNAVNIKIDSKPNIIEPVAVISGAEFNSIKSKFSQENHKKSSNISQNNSKNNKTTKSTQQINQRKGSSKSNLNHGLDLDLASKNAKNYDNSYLNIVANKLDQTKSHINMIRAPSNVKAEIMLKVELAQNGELNSYKIIQNSNYNFFNKAAVKILKMAAPFPAPPMENLQNSLECVVPIVFDTA